MSVQIEQAIYHNVDVTQRVRQIVQQEGGRLYVAQGTEYNGILGCDPAPGMGKILYVTFNGGQRAQFNERQEIHIPASTQFASSSMSTSGGFGVQVDQAVYHNVDVSQRLRQIVQQEGGRLYIADGTDYNQLFGIDPAPGVGKQLTITYRAGGPEQRSVFKERQQVNIQAVQQQQQQYANVTVQYSGGGGLVIDRAIYHNFDVSQRLRDLLAKEGGQRLYFPGGDYNAFFGYDPAPGVGKQLTIHYRVNGSPEQQAIFKEGQEINISGQQQFQQQQLQGVMVDRALYHNMDVSQHLRQLVAQEGGKRLYFPGGDYNAFFRNDPAPGVGKQLRIWYRSPQTGGAEKEVMFNEHAAFELF